MKKSLSVLLALFLALSLLSGCGKRGDGRQVIYPISVEPEYLDPQIASGSNSASVVAALFEGLVAYDENGQIVPAAAESFGISPNGLVYTFHLRSDLQWKLTDKAAKILGEDAASFSTALTAADFVFGLRRAVWKDTNSPAAPFLMSIENAPEINAGNMKPTKLGVKATDEHTLVITLSRINADFLHALTLPGSMPCSKAYFEATGGRYGLSAEYMIYNGPFYISNWNVGTAITVRKNDAYRNAADVKPASLYFSVNSEQATRAAKVESGTYEVAPLTGDQAAALSKVKGVTVRSFQNACFGLLFNCEDPVLQSSRVRRALAMTFQSEQIAQTLGLTSAAELLPQACLYGGKPYRDSAKTPTLPSGSAAEAKELMQAGMDQLNVKDIELTILCEEALETDVRALLQQWQAAFGVHFSIGVEALDGAALQARIKSGDYQLALSTLEFYQTSALAALLQFSAAGSQNLPRVHSAKYADIMDRVICSHSEKGCLAAMQEAEQFLLSQAVFVPIGEVKTYLGFAKGVSGVVASPTGDVVDLKNVTRIK